ncbi:MAG: glycosyltransferase family 4 protein [Planctomycetota bacterium]|nr:glycosyltransferase family 4 protein [Planctomycetota bacterium]
MAISQGKDSEAVPAAAGKHSSGAGTNGGDDLPIRVLLISPMITPYRNPLFNSLSRMPRVDLHVIHLCRRHRREWDLHLDEIEYPFTILTHGGLRHEGLTWGALLPRRMIRREFDLVVLPGYSHPAYLQAMLLARAMGKKVLLWSESTAADRRSGGRVREYLKRKIVSSCDGYLASGSASKEYLERLGAPTPRIQVVPNSTDTAFFARSRERLARDRQVWRRRLGLPKKVILFVGRIEQWKGTEDLIAAFLGLDPTGETGLVLAGSGPGLSRLRRRAKTRGWRNLFFPGFVPRDRLPLYYSTADVFVLPTWHDSWGFVVNEAMASGLPVVVSSVAGAARDLVRHGENGFVYPVRDVERLRSALHTILSQPALRERMGEASRRIIEEFSPEISAAAMADAIIDMGGDPS